MKLIADIDTIISNTKSFNEEVINFNFQIKKLENTSLESSIKEINSIINKYKQEICKKLKLINKNADTFIENIDLSTSLLQENEENLENVDISNLIDKIDKNAAVTSNYNIENAKTKLTGLSSFKLYNPVLYNPTTKEYLTGGFLKPLADGTYVLTSDFGYRSSTSTNGIGSTNHKGIDLGAPTGTRISSAISGKVIQSGYYGGYGNCVMVQNGKTTTLYGHMSSINVQEGQTISIGDKIGEVGSTGNSTGPHLHFEVHINNEPVDPKPYIGLKD